MESAVHTTPPITIDAMMPFVPLKPTATNTVLATMSVISVMPDTGLLPTMAIALAATVVNKNAITTTTKNATMAWSKLPITPIQKNTKVTTNAAANENTNSFMEMSFWVRTGFSSLPLPLNDLPAKPTALLITPHDLMMPITPLMAIPPMPMGRA